MGGGARSGSVDAASGDNARANCAPTVSLPIRIGQWVTPGASAAVGCPLGERAAGGLALGRGHRRVGEGASGGGCRGSRARQSPCRLGTRTADVMVLVHRRRRARLRRLTLANCLRPLEVDEDPPVVMAVLFYPVVLGLDVRSIPASGAGGPERAGQGPSGQGACRLRARRECHANDPELHIAVGGRGRLRWSRTRCSRLRPRPDSALDKGVRCRRWRA